LSHLLPTSGSTGSPKLVRHKYDNIEAAALNISTFFELTEKDRPLMVLPLYYTMGLSMVFSHFYVGATVLITNLNMTDRNFWKFIKEEHATSFTGVPYSYEILNLMRFFRMDLPDLTLLTQGGGRMPKELNLKFAEYCRDNGKKWIATYGQSECTARMAWLPSKWAVEKVGSIGIAVPNAELSLLDMEGKPITTPNTEGEMCYRGKNVTMGYARCREDLLLGDERHGFIHTGDLAYFDEDGCYYIVGRMGRFLKLFGMRVGLDECERIIKGKFPSLECACVGTDEKMLVYLTDENYKTQVKEELVNRLKLVASSFEVRIIPEIPKNEAGKTLYAKLENK
jgi:acyl-coenzyme A synthetase/AMP-(fatty) acid ligase